MTEPRPRVVFIGGADSDIEELMLDAGAVWFEAAREPAGPPGSESSVGAELARQERLKSYARGPGYAPYAVGGGGADPWSDPWSVSGASSGCVDPDPRVECGDGPCVASDGIVRCEEHANLSRAGDRVCDQPAPVLCSWRGYMGDSSFDDDDFACDQPARWCYRQPDRHRPSCSGHVVRFIDDVVMASFERIVPPGRSA